ncbi:MAG TPA: sigma-70 family RNA polymerase sigma factor [Terriglobia bacterium]|nr:sigma-70 family RNA polymerase sigma factor [Terriglobia bacterium]
MTESEAVIIEQARRGDPLAWERLVVRYTKRIYNICYRFVSRTDLAEDLTQEVFIKVYKNLSSYRLESGSFVTWLVSVTRNLLIDHYRQSKDDRVTVSSEGSIDDEEFNLLDRIPSEGPSPQAGIERQERNAILNRGLNLLSPELREAVVLRDLEELSYQEIGQILKIPDGTVKSRINRGRLELAKHLQKYRSQLQGY